MRILKPAIVILVIILSACFLENHSSSLTIRTGNVLERLMDRVAEIRRINIFHKRGNLKGSEKSTISASRPYGPGSGASIRSSRTYQYRSEARPGGPPARTGRNNNRSSDPAARRNELDLMRIENTEWIKKVTKQYSPDSWYMLMEYDSLPLTSDVPTIDGGIAISRKAAGTFYYLRGRTQIDMLSSMETNVHEIAHGYFDQNGFRYAKEKNMNMNRNNAEGYIYLGPSSGYFVSFPLRSMFPSKELEKVIPAELRTYRYDTYIDGTTSTQSDGVIGLLNELDAYYIGSRYCFDMLDAYKQAAGSDATGFFEWVTHTQSTMSAFYEFDFFIREYLLYLKKNYPSYYRDLVSYRPFGEAYYSVRTAYKELVDMYIARIKNEAKKLNSSGESSVKSEKGWLWIKSGNSNIASGTPMFSDLREKLMPVLSGRRYRDIAKDFPGK